MINTETLILRGPVFFFFLYGNKQIIESQNVK